MIGYPIDSHVTYDEAGVPVYDRAVSSAPLRKLIKMLFSDGVMPNPSTNLQVAAGTGMNVVVKPGFAICNGCMKLEEEQGTIAIQAADASCDRIDTIVLRLDDNDAVRSCELAVLTGTPSANPTRPALTRNASVWEVGLADIKISANSTAVTNVYITDTRYETARCGVISSISEFDTTKIYQQVLADLAQFKLEEQADFLAWFAEMKNQLSTDAAGNLQNQIDVERERINNLTKMEEGSTTGDTELQDIRVGADGATYPTAGEAVRRQFEKVQLQFATNAKRHEFQPVTLEDIREDLIDVYMGVRTGATVSSNLEFSDAFSFSALNGHCVYYASVKKGDSLVLTNAHSLTSQNSNLFIFNSERKWTNVIPFSYLKDSKYYNKEYTFEEDGFFYICFDYTTVQAGEFFYIKRKGVAEPLVLYAEKAEEYLVDAAVGDEVLDAIMNGKQVVVRVPNADGGNYTAVYSPILMYQLPNYMNNYLYLFFLNDGMDATTGMPTFNQLKMLLSRDYNATPLT